MAARAPDHPTLTKHAIRVVSRRTGLSPSTLRAWERRHGAVAPDRSEGQQRLYTEEEVERLRLLRQLTEQGHRIGQVARLSLQELRRLHESDPAPLGPANATPAAGASRRLEALMQAVRRMDPAAAERLLARAATDLSLADLLDGVVLPLLVDTGEAWRRGELGPRHEHLLTVQVRRLLERLLAGHDGPSSAPVAVLTTPSGQRHELGALTASLLAATEGWRAIYLGADCPAVDVAAVGTSCGARLIGLSMLRPVETDEELTDLMSLPTLLPRAIELVVGGRGALALSSQLSVAGFSVLPDLQSFRRVLRSAHADSEVDP